ncbi:hypothetical protein SDC9_54716 [bioreactor metagenome]|uniref:Uncharacterized protein n=1 Tax=bioreactor metagenome TaxID=1076179 RepID=A0A644X2L9_9ZZZZ
MSYNKYSEQEMAHIITSSQTEYFISRDTAGFHVLREGSSDGKELFSPVREGGKKNTKRGRVIDVSLLYLIIKNGGLK